MNASVAAVNAHVRRELAEQLRGPAQAALAARAAALRADLPPRPATSAARYTWWRSLNPEQARRAALLDRLEALHGHLGGVPALGCSPADPLPAAALEAAEGAGDAELDRLITAYRTASSSEGKDARSIGYE
ncbi:hypothetical protein AB0O57_29050 [Streptomyces sp. NPDC091201]|uniref:hypothetical protein n=1 Tax=Streptomyces sp. NPDC091201 TaxID=3155190 RepID=UPI00342DB447